MENPPDGLKTKISNGFEVLRCDSNFEAWKKRMNVFHKRISFVLNISLTYSNDVTFHLESWKIAVDSAIWVPKSLLRRRKMTFAGNEPHSFFFQNSSSKKWNRAGNLWDFMGCILIIYVFIVRKSNASRNVHWKHISIKILSTAQNCFAFLSSASHC